MPPALSLLHLADSVIAFPPLHLSSSARAVMLAELKRAEVDRLGVCRTARWRRWRVCLHVRKVSVHCPGRCDGEGAGKRGGEDGKRTRGAGGVGQRGK